MEALMNTTRLAAAVAVALGMLTGFPTFAQDYPNKPVRFLVPFNPGGSYDTISRLIGQKLTDTWKQQVVIENRPGAGSLIGTELAAKAPPDGHTIVMFGNNHAILPSVHVKATFSVQKDFDPVILVATVPALLLVHPSVPAR